MPELRPFDLSRDLEQTVTLLNHEYREPTTVEIERERERNRPPGEQRHVVVATNDGAVVGWSEAARRQSMPAGSFLLTVMVDPACRRQGIGGALYDDLMAYVRTNQATKLTTYVRDDEAAGRRFAEQRGFAIERHAFESVLDLATFDETPFAGAVDAALERGFGFLTLADAGNTIPARRKLFDLNTRTAQDVPGNDFDRSFEEFNRDVFESDWFRPDGQILAAFGDDWVGLGAVGYHAPTAAAYNAFTGVDRAFRGQGLAQALKVLGIRKAREYGARYIRTGNDSENAPMLAINRKLGYRPEPGTYTMVCTLA